MPTHSLIRFGKELKICLVNPVLFQLIGQVVNASDETLVLQDEEFVLVVDLFIIRPELHLEVTGLENSLITILVYPLLLGC